MTILDKISQFALGYSYQPFPPNLGGGGINPKCLFMWHLEFFFKQMTISKLLSDTFLDITMCWRGGGGRGVSILRSL